MISKTSSLTVLTQCFLKLYEYDRGMKREGWGKMTDHRASYSYWIRQCGITSVALSIPNVSDGDDPYDTGALPVAPSSTPHMTHHVRHAATCILFLFLLSLSVWAD